MLVKQLIMTKGTIEVGLPACSLRKLKGKNPKEKPCIYAKSASVANWPPPRPNSNVEADSAKLISLEKVLSASPDFSIYEDN